MIDQDELLFCVDENNNPIEPVSRQQAHAEGIWHRVTHVWVINPAREVLCHKRSILKDTSPGKWDPYLGGHILSGVDASVGAVQELKEEIGLIANGSDLDFIKVEKNPNDKSNMINNEFLYIYIYNWLGNLKDLKIEADEIDEVRWIDINSLKEQLLKDKNEKKIWSQPQYVAAFINYLKNERR